MMGSVTCKYGNSTVDVGSGFDDETRKYYTEHPDAILNHVIAIKYKEETTNKDGGKSLQFPVFISCRSINDKLFDNADGCPARAVPPCRHG